MKTIYSATVTILFVSAIQTRVAVYIISLFLASTVSTLHRNAQIWNACHPLLVTYYYWVTVYSPSMEAKKNKGHSCQPGGIEPGSVRNPDLIVVNCATRTVVPNELYSTKNANVFKPQITTFPENRKIQLMPKTTNHLFTCYLKCMCKSNPVCLTQHCSVIFLLASYVQWLYFLVWAYEVNPLTFSHLCSLGKGMQLRTSWVYHFIRWMNRFLYYDLDRFACVRIPTQIQINITIPTCTPPFTHFWV